jgi:hypothetical protein
MSTALQCGGDGAGDSAELRSRQERISILETVDRQYKCAAQSKPRQLTLTFPAATGISSICGSIFSVVDREDEEQRRIARLAWIIKSTILQTMLQFDDPRLGLASMIEAMSLAAVAVPTIASSVDDLVGLMGTLIAVPGNPKREWFQEQLTSEHEPRLPVAILAGLQGRGTPGWPAEVSADEDFQGHPVTLLRGRKDIAGAIFGTVVIPGTVRFTARPLLHDVLYGGRASDIVVLAYATERTYVPQPIALPADSTFGNARFPAPRTMVQEHDGQENQIDRWANESIWEELRSQHLDAAPLSDRDVSVPARFVLFADGSGAFLPDDKRVVELSDLLDGKGTSELSEERLPRKNVRDLEELDLIMLRLSGSGDYLDEVADNEMERAGLGSLRSEATEWKAWLHRVIKEHGDGLVARVGKDFGLRLRAASYLWEWAGNGVMAPHDFATFRALIATLAKLDPSAFYLGVDPYAREKWRQMEQVKAFHARAGATIRTALLERVKGLVAERRQVETVESIELPGVQAGRMGLLRISAVDSKPVRTPQSRLFHIFPLKGGTDWQR